MGEERWQVDSCDRSAVGTMGQAGQTATGAQTEGEGSPSGGLSGKRLMGKEPRLGVRFS